MLRNPLLALATSLALACHAAPADFPTTAPGVAKVLRYAFPVAETGFDPAQVTDLYSNTVLAHIFEAPLEFEYLALPARMRPNTAAALPEVSADFRRFVVTLRPGTYFADDAAFKGARRELVAADYVYAIKRHYDPRWKSGKLYQLESEKLLGLSELRSTLMSPGMAIVASTAPVTASILKSVLSAAFVTHNDPNPRTGRSARAPLVSGIVPSSAPVLAS